VLLEWRELEHAIRVYAANKPISYRALSTVAAAGAQLHIEGLKPEMLSKPTSRAAATEHDQQNHLVQRRCALESLGSALYGLIFAVSASTILDRTESNLRERSATANSCAPGLSLV
jgi:hypothetical protein